ncbi:signal peptidase I [Streptomyces sp. SCA3-4]|uniref:signal peptidase I n=1 Tax=Streptomyces sichuanensis TaxID=2871810 RepID=UPI001CE32B2E|nr:signal peptidase I [Streptomyces sichuanensis]MCA6093342.1 signal peptidase I [Streptomyces sichuanensis]
MGSRGRTQVRTGAGARARTGSHARTTPAAPDHGPAEAGAPPAATGGRASRRKAAKRAKRRRQRSAIKEVPILIGVALLIALVLKTFLLQAFVIPSGSMEQTIRIGDRVLVDKLTPWFGSRPERGDVVVFRDPGGWLDGEQSYGGHDPVVVKQVKEGLAFIGLLPSAGEQDLIKRVIGTGGDTVKCCDNDGRVTVNGKPLIEPYVHPGNPPSQLKFEVKVPAGRLFVMGDHRSDSADSRYHLTEPGQGTIAEGQVVGRAVVIAWPLGHWRGLSQPEPFAAVRDAPRTGTRADASAHSVSSMDQEGLIRLPSPAELPLVMGVVGLRRVCDRRQRGVRSGCGGLGGRRTFRSRRARKAARADG